MLLMALFAISAALPVTVFAAGGYVPYTNLGGPADDMCYALAQSLDTGFVLAGSTYGFGMVSGHNLLISKTDKEGNPVWSYVAEDTVGKREIRSMARTRDGGYILAGSVYYPPDSSGLDIIVIRLDQYGNRVWAHTFIGTRDDCANSVIQTSDTSFVLCGYTCDTLGRKHVLVMGLGESGWQVFTRVYNVDTLQGDAEAFSIADARPSQFCRYAVCGRCPDADSAGDAFVMLLGESGDVLGQPMVMPGPADDEARSVIALVDTVVVAGNTKSFGAGNGDIFVWRLTAGAGGSLTSMWKKTYGWAYGNEWLSGDKALVAAKVEKWDTLLPPYSVYTLAGATTSRGPDLPNPNFLLLSVNTSDGSQFWSHNGNARVHPSHPGNGPYDVACAVIDAFGEKDVINPWFKHGYVLAGTTNCLGLGGSDFHFFSCGPCGNLRECMKGETLELRSFEERPDLAESWLEQFPTDTFRLQRVIPTTAKGCTMAPYGWAPIEPTPVTVGSGGKLALGGSTIFLLPGDNRKAFFRYELAGPDWWHWDQAESIPPGPKRKRVKKGATMAATDDHVYALKGNNTLEFYRYATALNKWDSLAQPQFMKRVKGGFSAAVTLNTNDSGPVTYVYAGPGASNSEWLRFNTASAQWEVCQPATLPAARVKIGSGLAYDGEGKLYFLLGGGRENEFYVLDLTLPQPEWTRKAGLPLPGTNGKKKKVGEGGGIVASFFDRKLYALKGNNCLELWQYDPATDAWHQMPDIATGQTPPAKRVKAGGSLVASSPEGFLYCTIGNRQSGFWLFNLPVTESLFKFAGAASTASGKVGPAGVGKVVVQNPSIGMLKISYSLPVNEPATLGIYDIAGTKVCDRTSDQGFFAIQGLPAGIYVMKFRSAGYSEDRKIVVVR
jgi:hypothetical protein